MSSLWKRTGTTASRDEALTIEDCPDDLPNGMATILTVQQKPHYDTEMKATLDKNGYVRPLIDHRGYLRKDEWNVLVKL